MSEAENIEADAKEDTEEKPKVPSLLDLNPFDVKGSEGEMDAASNDGEQTNGEEKEEITDSSMPFKLKKQHLFTAFRMHYSLNSIIIKPFHADFFCNSSVQFWVKKAKEFNMRQAWNGISIGMMLFSSYKEAQNALSDLRVSFGSENTEVEIRHSKNLPEMPYRYPHEEVEYMIRDRIDQPLMSRVMVLEDLPEQATEDDLSDFFPDARTVLLLNHSDAMKGYGLVEFPAAHKLRDALSDYKKDGEEKVSVLDVQGQEVKLTKFSTRYNQSNYWLRLHPPKAEPKEELTDEQRVEICENLKTYLAERDTLLNGTEGENISDMIVESYWDLSEKMQVLAKKLNYDTCRKKQTGKKFPESKEMKINTISILGYPDEEDEEITAASGKIPSIFDIGIFQGQGCGRNKRSADTINAQSTKKSKHCDRTSSESGSCDGSVSGPAPLMSGTGDGSHKKNKGSTRGPLETTRWCSIPLPLKKPLASRNAYVEERLYFMAYPRKFDDRVLENVFCRFGGLIDAYFSKGSNYGYAKFSSKDAAHEAAYVLNDQLVAGNQLMVQIADFPGESLDGMRRSSRD